MIRMQLERRSHTGSPDLACPKFTCDYCGEPIDRAEGGLYAWDARLSNEAYYDGKPVDVYTLHKGDCDAWFRFAKGWHRDEPSTGELADLPAYLANNMNAPARRDREKARDRAGFGGAT